MRCRCGRQSGPWWGTARCPRPRPELGRQHGTDADKPDQRGVGLGDGHLEALLDGGDALAEGADVADEVDGQLPAGQACVPEQCVKPSSISRSTSFSQIRSAPIRRTLIGGVVELKELPPRVSSMYGHCPLDEGTVEIIEGPRTLDAGTIRVLGRADRRGGGGPMSGGCGCSCPWSTTGSAQVAGTTCLVDAALGRENLGRSPLARVPA